MIDTKYYLIAKSFLDKYIETQEYDNIYDLANKPYEYGDEQIIQDHLDTITSLYFDESKLSDSDWDIVLSVIKDIFEEENN